MSFTVVRFARFRLGIVPLSSWRGNTASTALPKTDRRPCPGISEIAVPELLKSLSATYRNPVREFPKHAAIPQLAERLSCFKSLKRSTAKTQDAAPEIQQPAESRKVKDAGSRANAKAPETPAKTEQAAPAPTDEVPPSKDEASTSKKDTTTQSNPGERLPPPTRDDPVTTSSIDRLSFAHDRPLCTDRDALAAMILAGLLTSDPSQADTPGCQTIPEDAKLELLERSPSVFPFMRMVRVKVISPTHPDLTSGFTIEIGH